MNRLQIFDGILVISNSSSRLATDTQQYFGDAYGSCIPALQVFGRSYAINRVQDIGNRQLFFSFITKRQLTFYILWSKSEFYLLAITLPDYNLTPNGSNNSDKFKFDSEVLTAFKESAEESTAKTSYVLHLSVSNASIQESYSARENPHN